MKLNSELQMQVFSRLKKELVEEMLAGPTVKHINTLYGSLDSLNKFVKQESSRISRGNFLHIKNIKVYDVFFNTTDEDELSSQFRRAFVMYKEKFFITRASQTILRFNTGIYGYQNVNPRIERFNQIMDVLMPQLELALPPYKINSSRYSSLAESYSFDNNQVQFDFLPGSERVSKILAWKHILEKVVEYSLDIDKRVNSSLHLLNVLKSPTLQSEFIDMCKDKNKLNYFLNQYKTTHENFGATYSGLNNLEQFPSPTGQVNQETIRMRVQYGRNKNDLQ